MTTTTSIGDPGRTLREARERAGLTRAQLAALADCSLAQLAAIEQGAVPRRSRVLDRALAVIGELNDDDPAATPGRVEESGGESRHGPA